MSSVNLLALPKRRDFLENFIVPPGMVAVREDINSLEPCVLTYRSQDKNLLKLYGKGAKPHDGYLFVAWHIYNKVQQYYDIEGNTKAGLSVAKKKCKVERDTTKPGFLGWFYGIGAKKLSSQNGIPLKDCIRVLRTLDELFPGKQALHNALVRQWHETGGHIVSGRGLPICVCNSKLKDIVNRDIQNTGHKLLERLLYHRNQYRMKHDIPMWPYIPDWHDESIWLTYPEHIDKVKEAIEYSYQKLNEELQWNVEIRHGGISVGTDLTVRCED